MNTLKRLDIALAAFMDSTGRYEFLWLLIALSMTIAAIVITA